MPQGQIRIISGMWRGRKLMVPDVPGLRPTTDQIRETVFNWLQPFVVGAHCLDLFAGSGALGIEALSRGAASIVMMDSSDQVIIGLKKQLSVFNATHADVYQGVAPHDLKKPKNRFNLVFLDPPFGKDLLLPACFYLEESQYLADEALIYLESGVEISAEQLPSTWAMHKRKKTGQVFYYLIQREQLSQGQPKGD
jgi:16S rRNA (guanine966-N2)-methyltransferase